MDFIEIGFHNVIFSVFLLQFKGFKNLLYFAFHSDVIVTCNIFDQLLGNRGSALLCVIKS